MMAMWGWEVEVEVEVEVEDMVVKVKLTVKFFRRSEICGWKRTVCVLTR